MLVMFLVYSLFPILIIMNIFKTDDKKILKHRLVYAIPAMILTVVNVCYFCYDQFYKNVEIFDKNPLAFLIPALALLVVIIIFNSGKRGEKLMQTEIAVSEIEKARDVSNNNRKHNVVLSDEDLVEKL